MKENKNGITLIALVVTIIVLIILAGVSINLLLGDNGIITKAIEAKEQQEIASIAEKLELVKAPIQVEKIVVTIDDYLAELQKPGVVDFEINGIDRVDENNAYIIADKYQFLLEYESNGNLKITYQGKVGKLLPRIVTVEVSNTTNSITAKIEAKRANKYNFYIKDNIDGEYELIEEDNETGEYIYSGLTQNTTYYIKLEAINKNGSVSSEITRSTSTMVELVEAEIEATIVPNTWTNGNVTTKIKLNTEKDVKDYTIQYAQSEQALTTEELKNVKWTNYTEAGILSIQNGIIYTRLYDGTNATSYMSREITIIDKTKPVINNLTATTNSITISAADEVSGIVGYVVSTSSTEPTTFVECDNTKTFNKTEEGLEDNTQYYIWVKDEAGNISEVQNIRTEMVTDGTAEGAITTTDAIWKNGKASITLSTNTSYDIQYQVDSISGEWTTGKQVNNLIHNSVVNARLWDGYNGGDYLVINIRDSIDPTAQIELSSKLEVTGEKITATITHIDEQMGVNTSECKWIYNTTATIGTEDDKYAGGGTFTSNTQSIDLIADTAGTYYLHVLTVDNAGNRTETVSEAITISVAQNLADVVKPGDYISYTPTAQTFSMTTAQTGYGSSQSFNTASYTGLWQVLYNDSTHGLQIISADSVADFYLKGKVGYNNVVSTLNAFSKKYENSSYTITDSGRILGTNPTNSSEDTTSNVTLRFSFNSSTNSGAKQADTRYTTDYEAMKNATNQSSSGIQDINGYYWIASRREYDDSEVAYFSVYAISGDGEVDYRSLYDIYEYGNSYEYEYGYGVRPIVTIKNGVKAIRGNGSSTNPYQIREN